MPRRKKKKLRTDPSAVAARLRMREFGLRKKAEAIERKKAPSENTYAARDQVLLRMGYTSYSEYLSSPLWCRVREEVVRQEGGVCRLCKAVATEVHHITYREDVLKGENLDDLVQLCRQCHTGVEFAKGGRKRTLIGAQMAFCKAVRKLGLPPQEPKKNLHRKCVRCGNSAKRGRKLCKPCGKAAAGKGP